MYISPDIENWVKQIHQKAGKIVLVTSGAGSLIQSWLFGVAGASQTILETQIPYAKLAFDQFIGREPDKYVSLSSGRLLAAHAYKRACLLNKNQAESVYGVSCTGAISTDRPKRGPHHAIVSVWGQNKAFSYHLVLAKGVRSRQEEELIISRLILHCLAQTMELPHLPFVNDWLSLLPSDHLTNIEDFWTRELQKLLQNKVDFVGVAADGQLSTKETLPKMMLSGSFNPLHKGHQCLAETATSMLGHPIAYELSAYNVDKPPLKLETIQTRLFQFVGSASLYVTHAPTFLDKARLFPNTIFVVGYDTAVRIFAPRYYQDRVEMMMTALNEIKMLGCCFLVAGRAGHDGVFYDAADLEPPEAVADLFIPIPMKLFRQDISSTALRQQNNYG